MSRNDYADYVEQHIELYKDSIPRRTLLEIADEAVASLRTQKEFDPADFMLLAEVDRLIARRLQLPSYRQWREANGLTLRAVPAIVDQFGRGVAPDTAQAHAIVSSGTEINEALISALAARPEEMHKLPARKFEELIAELLRREGIEVTLTPASRDGGRDIVARVRSPLGRFLCYVECKKYSPHMPVGVRPVRELYGVVVRDRVTQGILITSSRFTRAALDFQHEVPHQLSLKSYADVVGWLGSRRASVI